MVLIGVADQVVGLVEGLIVVGEVLAVDHPEEGLLAVGVLAVEEIQELLEKEGEILKLVDLVAEVQVVLKVVREILQLEGLEEVLIVVAEAKVGQVLEVVEEMFEVVQGEVNLPKHVPLILENN